MAAEYWTMENNILTRGSRVIKNSILLYHIIDFFNSITDINKVIKFHI